MSDYKPKSKKRSFVLFYNNIKPALALLDDNYDLGELFRAICDYEIDGIDRTDFRSPQAQSLYQMIKYSLDENKQKWERRCEINSAIRTNGTNGTNGTIRTDKDKEKEKEIDKDKDKDKVKDKEKEGSTPRANITAVMDNVVAALSREA